MSSLNSIEAYKKAIVAEYIIAKILYNYYYNYFKGQCYIKIYHNNTINQYDIDLELKIITKKTLEEKYTFFIECKLIENNNNLCIYPNAGTGNGLNKIIDYVKNKLKINNNKLNIENTIENEEKKVDVIFTNLKLDDSKLYIAYYKKGNKKLIDLINKIYDKNTWKTFYNKQNKKVNIIYLTSKDFDESIELDDNYIDEYNTHYNAIKNYNISQKDLIDSYIESRFKDLNI